jgi:outer membrane protein assembly factor BamB
MRSQAARISTRVILFAALLAAGGAEAVCPPSCPIKGGAPAEDECHSEFAGAALRLNFPPFNPSSPQPATEVRCFDGDAGCDVDGAVDRACVFDVDVCLRNPDPELKSCVPQDVVAVTVAGADTDPDLQGLQAALDALLPATSNVCTEGRTLRVPLGASDSTGALQRGGKTVEITVRTADERDTTDRLTLACVPRGWPSHGYNHANHRSNPSERVLSPANAASLEVKWHLDLGSGVTSTPTVGNGLVYVTAWNGNLYAVEPESGEVRWTYSVGNTFTGLQSSATLTADGRVVIADSGRSVTSKQDAAVHCLDAVTGDLFWKTTVGTNIDHFWSSPQVANGRVIVGVASHTDNPCTKGRLFALDLDTGDLLWTLQTVPDRVCKNDTGIACTDDADCGGAECVDGRGAGITATVALDPGGEVVYMNTVGCYTFPSIGDSDSMFKIDAASGEVIWKNRVQEPEQFGYCPMDASRDCGADADCAQGTCRTKGFYHDFGFLNGPLLVEADDGEGGRRNLVVSGSKDGTLYAFDPADGSIVWTNEVLPTPITPGFAGFGLFNGAVGFADGRFFAALNEMISPAPDPYPDRLRAFSAVNGSTVWSDAINASWGSVGLANDVLFVGDRETTMLCAGDDGGPCEDDGDCGPEGTCLEKGPFYVYDARDGTRLREILMPSEVTSGPSIVDGTVYAGYGVGAPGGVIAFTVPFCLGDCDNDGVVEVHELVRGVGIGMDEVPFATCPRFDGDDDDIVAIYELVGGTANSLSGCE